MFKPLKEAQKFQSGSSLWIMFFELQRRLFKQINWRTGFILQSIKHQSSAPSKPVLISLNSAFPGESLLCLPLKLNLPQLGIYDHWRRLDKPSSRVFLPLGCSGEDLNRSWPREEMREDLFYYEDSGGRGAPELS